MNTVNPSAVKAPAKPGLIDGFAKNQLLKRLRQMPL
jgi:hypothetical protein